MACEVRSRLCNGQGNLARGVQTVHSPSLSLLPSLPFCLFHSSVAGWHPLCILYLCTLSSVWSSPDKMPSQIVTKDQRWVYLSLTHFSFPFFCCLPILSIPSWDDWCSPCMQRLTIGLEISWLERMESWLTESESIAQLKPTLSRVTLWSIFPLHLVRIMNSRSRTQKTYVLSMIRGAMNMFSMKCVPLSNIT